MGLKTSTPAKDKNTHIDRQVDLPFLKTDQVTQTDDAHAVPFPKVTGDVAE